MEEILASIRRIISEDDAPAEAAAPAEPEPAPEPEAPFVMEEPEPEALAEVEAIEEEDVLELTEPVSHSIGDLDVFEAAPAPAPEPEPEPVAVAVEQPIYTPPAAPPAPPAESLVSPPAAAAATSAFSQLSQRIAMPAPSTSLDDVVRELLNPLLREWLDKNLAAIVQAKVDEEVERIARRHLG